jgi:hypothetical protein
MDHIGIYSLWTHPRLLSHSNYPRNDADPSSIIQQSLITNWNNNLPSSAAERGWARPCVRYCGTWWSYVARITLYWRHEQFRSFLIKAAGNALVQLKLIRIIYPGRAPVFGAVERTARLMKCEHRRSRNGTTAVLVSRKEPPFLLYVNSSCGSSLPSTCFHRVHFSGTLSYSSRSRENYFYALQVKLKMAAYQRCSQTRLHILAIDNR